MPKTFFTLLILATWLMGAKAFAVAIGMPEEGARWGYALGAARVSVDDPDTASRSEWALRPLNLIYTDRWFYDARYWGEAFYQETALDAGAGQVGQQVKQFGARLSLQKSLALTPAIAPWFGAGLQLSHNRFHKRHTVDSDGYLVASYPDRNEFHAALLLNLVVEQRLNRNWDVAAKLEQVVPLAEGVSESSVSAVLLYRY